jgi:oligopeptide/dipeptide ABC transporter ATP-binding protein
MKLLRVENLAIDLVRDGNRHRLVYDASFEMESGETLAIVGESGSGKSLTALAVMGLLSQELEIAGGHIHFDGRDLAGLTPAETRALRGSEIAMIFQEPMTSLNPVRSIGAQLTEGMRLKLGLTREAARARAIELLAEVGVSAPERRLKQYPHQFSGGMRQRVMIAMALSCKPRLILADEPTTALDVTIQAQILALTTRLCREHGLSLILITHNLGIVARYAQRVAVMYGGRVVEQAAARALYRTPAHPYTRGLLGSVPRLDLANHGALRSIPGAPPDPMAPPGGCWFHPRCPKATAICAQDAPEPQWEGTHMAACWHADLAVPAVQEAAE